MSFLGRMFSTGARYLSKAAPVASFLGRAAPSVLSNISAFASNPLVNAAANRFGINPNVMRNIATGASNIGSGLSLVPGVAHDVKYAARSAMAAAEPAKASMAQLYRTLHPA
jgi:hypothetical protein